MATPKPANPLTGWAIKVVDNTLTACRGVTEININFYSADVASWHIYPEEEEHDHGDVVSALIDLWREARA